MDQPAAQAAVGGKVWKAVWVADNGSRDQSPCLAVGQPAQPAKQAKMGSAISFLSVAPDGSSFDFYGSCSFDVAYHVDLDTGTAVAYSRKSNFGGKTTCNADRSRCYSIAARHPNERIKVFNGNTGEVLGYYGTGEYGCSGDGGPASQATFGGGVYEVEGCRTGGASNLDIAADPAGNLFIADVGNHALRMVDLNGMIDRIDVDVALGEPFAVATDAVGDLFVADVSGHKVYSIAGIAQSGPVDGALTPQENPGGLNPSEASGCSQACVGDPVNTATGNYWETVADLSVPGRGVPLAFTRTYNSVLAATDGPLGYGWSYSYGASLQVGGSSATVAQEDGSQITFILQNGVYVAPKRVLATLVHNADGTYTLTRRAQTKITFDSTGRLVSQQDLNGSTTTVSYPTATTTVVTDPAGRTLTLNWDGGHIVGVADSATPARMVSFQYQDGNLSGVVDVGGDFTQYGYDGAHRVVTVRRPRFAGDTTTNPPPVTTNHYDAQGRIDRQSDPLGRTTAFDYSSVPGSTIITDPKGNSRLHTYVLGQLVSQTFGYGTPQAATWTYTYDSATLQRTSAIDPLGRITRTRYDTNGNPVRRIDALNRVTTMTYNALNQPLTITDPAGVTTTMSYDAAGNLLSKSTPLVGSSPVASKTTSYTYGDPAHPGDITAMTDPTGQTWAVGYDTYGNIASGTDPLGNETRYCSDAIGRREKVITAKGAAAGVTCATPSPAFTTTITSDPFGAPLTVTDPLGNTTVSHYDGDHNLDYFIDAAGNRTTLVYDAAGQRTEIRHADGCVPRTLKEGSM